jgi:hypothetical protein
MDGAHRRVEQQRGLVGANFNPFVFGSDTSKSGFTFGLESCPAEMLDRLPRHHRLGHISCGLWSAANRDAVRQRTSSAIQWEEFFCPLAGTVASGPLLVDAHVVFVIDNNSDVSVINHAHASLEWRRFCEPSVTQQETSTSTSPPCTDPAKITSLWAGHRAPSFIISVASPPHSCVQNQQQQPVVAVRVAVVITWCQFHSPHSQPQSHFCTSTVTV